MPQLITLTDELGRGGEATIHNIAEQSNMVAKLYHKPTAQQEAKLRAMLLNPPKQPNNYHVAIAWPMALLYRNKTKFLAIGAFDELRSPIQTGQFVGFLMPKIKHGRAIFHMYNPVMRKQLPYGFDWRALHRTASNLCAVVSAIHTKRYVIGDLNESNILVGSESEVTLVDCDSFQVMDEQGMIYRCLVGKPEYTPPELQGVHFTEVDQRPAHDLFGLGVLLFQLLMEGHHPFAGVLQENVSVGRVDLYAIREGIFPYDNPQKMSPPPAAPAFNSLDPTLQALFITCFVDGHKEPDLRPSAEAWQIALQQAEEKLQPCQQGHLYSPHLFDCPVCKAASHNLPQIRHPQRVPPIAKPIPKWVFITGAILLALSGLSYNFNVMNHTESVPIATKNSPTPIKPTKTPEPTFITIENYGTVSNDVVSFIWTDAALISIPLEIGQLINLQQLDMRHNHIKTIPVEIAQIHDLQNLTLSFNQIIALPPEIGRLQQLQRLTLEDNQLTTLPPEIGQLENLQRLHLVTNKITQLPPEIGRLQNLQWLILSNNNLTSLPVEIGQLQHLQWLDLRSNNLIMLPLELGQMQNLQKLELQNNRLTFLPIEIGQLHNLQNLQLNNNELTSLPATIGQLLALQSLVLPFNKLTALPPEIGQLENLQTLDLHGNNIILLPPEIGQLQNLEMLDLQDNNLTDLPPEIGQLAFLEELDLRSNHLTSLPPEMGQLEFLKALYLQGNNITTLPPEIKKLSNLKIYGFNE